MQGMRDINPSRSVAKRRQGEIVNAIRSASPRCPLITCGRHGMCNLQTISPAPLGWISRTGRTSSSRGTGGSSSAGRRDRRARRDVGIRKTRVVRRSVQHSCTMRYKKERRDTVNHVASHQRCIPAASSQQRKRRNTTAAATAAHLCHVHVALVRRVGPRHDRGQRQRLEVQRPAQRVGGDAGGGAHRLAVVILTGGKCSDNGFECEG